MKNNKKLLVVLAIIALLILAYWFGGNGPGSRSWTIEPETTPLVPPNEEVESGMIEEAEPEAQLEQDESVAIEREEESADEEEQNAEAVIGGPEEDSVKQELEQDLEIEKDQYQTEPVPEGKPHPIEPQDVAIDDTEGQCSISVSCATILDNMELLDQEKHELVPADGWILEPVTVTFYHGESVFNVLQRTMKQNKIHMEFVNTPMYNSAYIEGINNLYEFDVGELSGWMYQVNGWFPNYGCSRYQLKDGDVIEFEYTCDLGRDVGGLYSAGS